MMLLILIYMQSFIMPNRKSIIVLFFVSLVLVLWGCFGEHSTKTEAPEMVRITGPWAAMTNASMPRLFSDGSSIHATWVTTQGPVSTLYLSQYTAEQWTPAIAVHSGDNWFVNWADFPQVAANDGHVVTTYLEKSSKATYAYDLRYNIFNARTQTWYKGLKLHSDTTKTEHGFVSIRPYRKGFLAAWLDGRLTTSHHQGAMTIRARSISPDGTLGEEMLLDERVCDCCQTAMTTDSIGHAMVAYRDRSLDEIRDISVVSMLDSDKWSSPSVIGSDEWQIAGCPVNGPAMDRYANHTALVWFSAPENDPQVKIAFSDDDQGSFGPAFRLDSGNATGRVAVVMLNENEAAVLWMEPADADKAVLQLQKVSTSGRKSLMVTIAETTADRASGFAQISLLHDQLYIAYTRAGKDSSMIQMVSLPVDTLLYEF